MSDQPVSPGTIQEMIAALRLEKIDQPSLELEPVGSLEQSLANTKRILKVIAAAPTHYTEHSDGQVYNFYRQGPPLFPNPPKEEPPANS